MFLLLPVMNLKRAQLGNPCLGSQVISVRGRLGPPSSESPNVSWAGPRCTFFWQWNDAPCQLRGQREAGADGGPPADGTAVPRLLGHFTVTASFQSKHPQRGRRKMYGILWAIFQNYRHHFCLSQLIRGVTSSSRVKGLSYTFHILGKNVKAHLHCHNGEEHVFNSLVSILCSVANHLLRAYYTQRKVEVISFLS